MKSAEECQKELWAAFGSAGCMQPEDGVRVFRACQDDTLETAAKKVYEWCVHYGDELDKKEKAAYRDAIEIIRSLKPRGSNGE